MFDEERSHLTHAAPAVRAALEAAATAAGVSAHSVHATSAGPCLMVPWGTARQAGDALTAHAAAVTFESRLQVTISTDHGHASLITFPPLRQVSLALAQELLSADADLARHPQSVLRTDGVHTTCASVRAALEDAPQWLVMSVRRNAQNYPAGGRFGAPICATPVLETLASLLEDHGGIHPYEQTAADRGLAALTAMTNRLGRVPELVDVARALEPDRAVTAASPAARGSASARTLA